MPSRRNAKAATRKPEQDVKTVQRQFEQKPEPERSRGPLPPADAFPAIASFDKRAVAVLREIGLIEVEVNAPPPTSTTVEPPEEQLSGGQDPVSSTIQWPETENYVDWQMREQADKSFIQDGVRYWPLPLAAEMAQAPRQTLLNWIKNETEFEGEPLQSYYFAPLDRYFVSDESIYRMANRFIKWPLQEPVGPLTIGATKYKAGFIGMLEAAAIVGVSKRTMWLWCSEPEKAPSTDKPLDVIKCTTSGYFYIREKDAYELKKLIPQSGLQRGRRPKSAPQP